MAEVVDAADLKSADGNVVGVQVPLPPSTAAAEVAPDLVAADLSVYPGPIGPL